MAALTSVLLYPMSQKTAAVSKTSGKKKLLCLRLVGGYDLSYY
jgi:hypothetical protein